MRIAFFTPLSPLHTAVADHSESLLPHLAQLADVDLYIDDGYCPTNPAIAGRFAIHSYRRFRPHAGQYDAVLYAMGDDARFHNYVYEAMQQFPGIVILHDTTLHRTMINRALRSLDPEQYLREMRYAYGMADFHMAWQVISGFGAEYATKYPLFERVVDRSLGVIVHNAYAAHQVLRYCPNARVVQVNQHFFLPPDWPQDTDLNELRLQLRARLGLGARFVIGSFGLFVPDKRLDTCLRAFARLRERHPEAAYLLVGSHPKGYDLPRLVRDLGLGQHVLLTGWKDPVPFTQHMCLLDVGVHLRYPHVGGTPFTPIRLMGLGIATVLSDIEPLAGLPEGCCAKIAPDRFEEEALLAILTRLAEDNALRERLGEAGAEWIRLHHDPRIVARRYVENIQRFVSTAAMDTRDRAAEHRAHYLIREAAAFAVAAGIHEQDDTFLQSLARLILWRDGG